MKLKYKFIVQKLGDKYAAVTVDEDADKFNGMLKVNELGKILIETLSNDVETSDLQEAIKDKFNATDKEEQMSKFLKQLDDAGLLIK